MPIPVAVWAFTGTVDTLSDFFTSEKLYYPFVCISIHQRKKAGLKNSAFLFLLFTVVIWYLKNQNKYSKQQNCGISIISAFAHTRAAYRRSFTVPEDGLN